MIKEHPDVSVREYFLLYVSTSGTGYCFSCGKETEIDWKNTRFFRTCGGVCYEKTLRSKTSERQIQRWKEDEKYREHMKEISRKTLSRLMSDPTFAGWKTTITSTSLEERWKDPEYRAKQSYRAIRQNSDQDSLFGKPYSGWTIYNGLNFRSKWEAKFAEYLDMKDIEWEYESLHFAYKNSKGKESRYIPDFYLPVFNLFVEIKAPYYQNEDTPLKLEAVRKGGFDIVLIEDTNNYNILYERI